MGLFSGYEDIEIPQDISANDLIIALSEVYGLRFKKELMYNYYIRCDEPKALLMGENLLRIMRRRCLEHRDAWRINGSGSRKSLTITPCYG